MSMSPHVSDRPSAPPLTLETTFMGAGRAPAASPIPWAPRWAQDAVARIPPGWLGVSGYLALGVVAGLVLIVAVTLSRRSAPTSASTITDDVVRLHAKDIADDCWSADERNAKSAHLAVSMDLDVTGKVVRASATGESAAMRACVESRVKTWEFLPQAENATITVPFEVDRR